MDGEKFRTDNPLWDSTLPLEERLDYLIEEMTLDEKFSCLTTSCPDIPRLGIRRFYLGGEAAHGIEARHDQDFNRGEAEETTSFPQPVGMSATWDPELIQRIGEAVGEEARGLYSRHRDGGLCRWAPTVDMGRDPRWGRTEEGYGEDPYLTGRMASAYILGMRGEDDFYLRCGATLKHFYANNKEENRSADSSSLDPRNKHEYYMEPFRRCIVQGQAEAVMTAYNEINGVPCIVNPEVNGLLRERFGLPGHVVCDGGDMQQTVKAHHFYKDHAQTVAAGLKAGVDCFTDDPEVVEEAAREAYAGGWIQEEDLNRSVRHSFSTRIRLGLYDRQGLCPYRDMGEKYVGGADHGKLAEEAAREAVVLLKNEDHFLPLSKEEGKRVAVIGPLGNVWYKDWYGGIPPVRRTLFDGVQEETAGAVFHDGYDWVKLRFGKKYAALDEEGGLLLSEEHRAEIFRLEDWGNGSFLLYAFSAGRYVKADEECGRLLAGNEEAFGWNIREAFDLRPFHEKEEDRCAWDGREKSSLAGLLRMLTWDGQAVWVDGLGRLSFGPEREGTPVELSLVRDGLREAGELAEKADIVIAAVGCNPMINGKEEIDRADLALPLAQERLLREVYRANPATVMVLVSNYPYAVSWEQEKLPAIVWSASGCQELGRGLAQILFGEGSPAGRLNMTWHKDSGELPSLGDYDIIRGRRTYQYNDRPVLYPFGHGLSYTEFRYEGLDAALDGDGVKVSFFVINTGQVQSDEVAQLYVRQENSRAERPILQLKGFRRLRDIQPGERRKAEMYIPREELEYYDVVSGGMVLEEGMYVVMAGASSADIRLKTELFVPGTVIEGRDAFRHIRADHFDDCLGIRLYQGHEAETGVYRLAKDGCGRLTFRNLSFSGEPEECVFYLHRGGRGRLSAEAGGTRLCCLTVNGEAEVSGELSKEGRRLLAQATDVSIEIMVEGEIGLTGFLFRG